MTFHYNHPTKPKELRILEFLHHRMLLPRDYLKRMHNLEKGYVGEVRFYNMLKAHLESDCIVLYDLPLTSNGSVFQIDCTIIQQRDIWHLEIKNYKGDFQMKDKAMYSLESNRELKNPLNQLERGNFLWRQLLGDLGYKLPLSSRVLFVHPAFTLYQCSPNQHIIHPSQILRFIHHLNNTPSQLGSGHYKLAHRLFSTQISEDLEERLPAYKLDELRNGVRCMRCRGGFLRVQSQVLCCSRDGCGYTEGRDSAVMRSVVEFGMLFPEKKITTRAVLEWCAGSVTEHTARKILMHFMHPVGGRKNRHYIFQS